MTHYLSHRLGFSRFRQLLRNDPSRREFLYGTGAEDIRDGVRPVKIIVFHFVSMYSHVTDLFSSVEKPTITKWRSLKYLQNHRIFEDSEDDPEARRNQVECIHIYLDKDIPAVVRPAAHGGAEGSRPPTSNLST